MHSNSSEESLSCSHGAAAPYKTKDSHLGGISTGVLTAMGATLGIPEPLRVFYEFVTTYYK